MAVAGILLASGVGRRFGANKLLHPLPDGTPIAVAAARNLVAALPGSVAVVRAANSVLARQLRQVGCRITVCRDAEEGMGRTLAAGVRAARDASGWVVALADMPFLQSESIRTVADGLNDGATIAAPSFEGRRGHPVGLARRFKDDLLALEGDAGARSILAAHEDWITLYEVFDPGVLRDIDTPADLEG